MRIKLTPSLSRNHAVKKGEHTRPRVFRSAPSPIGSSAADHTKRCELFEASQVAGEAPATAPGAGALPNPTASFRLSLALVIMSLVLGSRPVQGANVELDSPATPAGYVALLLINEVPFPGERAYVSEEESKAAMLSVLWVLHCRASLIPPGYTQKQVADVQSSNVIDVMTAGGIKGQVDGFYKDSAGRPVAVPRVHERVVYLSGLANRGQPGKMARLLTYARDLARQYFQTGLAAKDIFAELRKIGPKPVTGRGYAWMTDVRGFDPGGAFVCIPDSDQGALGGNRFYTLEKRK